MVKTKYFFWKYIEYASALLLDKALRILIDVGGFGQYSCVSQYKSVRAPDLDL
jgi:hypothetical protein